MELIRFLWEKFGFVGFLFYIIGRLVWMGWKKHFSNNYISYSRIKNVELSISELLKFKDTQEILNKNAREEKDRMWAEIERKDESNGRRFDQIMARIDDLFALWVEKKK